MIPLALQPKLWNRQLLDRSLLFEGLKGTKWKREIVPSLLLVRDRQAHHKKQIYLKTGQARRTKAEKLGTLDNLARNKVEVS